MEFSEHDDNLISQIKPNELFGQTDFLDLIKQVVRDDPDRIAMAFANPSKHGNRKQISYQELLECSEGISAGLIQRGVSKGTRVLMLLKPGFEFAVVNLALHRIAATPILIDMGMGLRRMLQCVLECKPQVMIGIPKAFWLRWIFPRYFRSIQWAAISRRSVFWPNAITIQSLQNAPAQVDRLPEHQPADVSTIVFTSGSTGAAKGVELTHQQILDRQFVRDQYDQLPSGSIELTTFPAFMLMSLASGRTCVLPDIDMTRPGRAEPEKLVNAIQDHQASYFFAGPILLRRLTQFCADNKITLRSVRQVVTGGAPLSFDVLVRLQAIAPSAKIRVLYGSTEALPISEISFDEIADETIELTHQGSGVCVGRPVNETEVAIVRNTEDAIVQWQDDLRLAHGEIGEIAVRGCCVTNNYFERTELTRQTTIANASGGSWYRTGDLGYVDDKNRIWLVGRKKHLVQTSSRSYYPIQIEGMLHDISGAVRTALVGVVRHGKTCPAILYESPKPRTVSHEQTRDQIRDRLREHGIELELIMRYPGTFPVDKRHHSKIERLELAKWAQKRL